MKSHKLAYGECAICDTPLQERLITQSFWIRGKLIVVENVPAGVCPHCGEKVVKAEVGQWLAALIENPERLAAAPRISVPKIQYDAAETPIAA